MNPYKRWGRRLIKFMGGEMMLIQDHLADGELSRHFGRCRRSVDVRRAERWFPIVWAGWEEEVGIR